MNILNWFIYERGPVASKSNNIKKWQQQTFFVICPQTFQSYIMYFLTVLGERVILVVIVNTTEIIHLRYKVQYK